MSHPTPSGPQPPGAGGSRRTARFTVPSIAEERNARDLQNVLVSIAGVARIEINRQDTPILTIEYDSAYVGEETLRQVIQRSGYPVEEQ